MRDFEVKGPAAERLYKSLQDQGLLEETELARIFRLVKEYARRYLTPTIETELKLDPHTGTATGISGKITPGEPTSELRKRGYLSVDALLELANSALGSIKWHLWRPLQRCNTSNVACLSKSSLNNAAPNIGAQKNLQFDPLAARTVSRLS